MRRLTAVLTLALAVLTTSACTSTGTGIEAFDREQTDADRLPQAAMDIVQVDADSSRLLAEDGDFLYFAATASDPVGKLMCVVVYDRLMPQAAFSGCTGGDEVGLGSIHHYGTIHLIRGLTEPADGWRMLAPNLYISD